METREIESYVRKSVEVSPKLSALSPEDMLCFGVTGLNEEAGEVAGLLCREVYKKNAMPEYKWLEELGDVLWYLTAATIARGLTLEDLWNYNVQKLDDRYGDERQKEEEK